MACVSHNLHSLSSSIEKSLDYIIGAENYSDSQNLHFEIDILYAPTKLALSDKNTIDLGLDSIAIRSDDHFTVLKSSVAIKHALIADTFVTRLLEKAMVTMPFKGNEFLLKYKTISFRENILNKNEPFALFDLYRHSELVLQRDITLEKLTKSLTLSINYLRRHLMKDRADYEYNYYNRTSVSPAKYHEQLRCYASLWALLENKNSAAIIKYANKLITLYIDESNISEPPKRFDDHKMVDVGSISISLLCALSCGDCAREKKHLLEQAILLFFWPETGRFYTHMQEGFLQKNSATEQTLPLMAVTALLRANKAHVPVAKQSIEYYLALYQKNPIKYAAMALWLIRSIYELVCYEENSIFIDGMFLVAHDICKQQQFSVDNNVDLYGSFGVSGFTLQTAVSLEAISYAALIADKFGFDVEFEKFCKVLFMGLRYLLQLQVGDLSAFNEEALGGFKNSPVDSVIRIDVVQHAVFALQNAIKLFG